MVIFLISVCLGLLILLWRNGFFRGSSAVHRKSETHDKEIEGTNEERGVTIVEDPVLLAGEVRIPEWHSTCYARWDEVTPQHRKFYQYWLEHLEKGDFVNIGENVAYVFIYMKIAINSFKKDKNIRSLRECFKKLQKAYGEKRDLQLFLGGWLLHAYLFLDDYSGAWGVRKDMGFYDFLDISDILFFGRKCSGLSIDGQDVISILESTSEILTDFGKDHQREIANIATRFFNSYHEKHGKNLIESLHEQLASPSQSEEPKESGYTKIIVLFGAPCPGIYSNIEISKSVFTHDDICSAIFSPEHAPAREIRYAMVPQSTEAGIKTVLRKVLRECENVLREKKGLPKVGEGWISETELFNKLREAFPNERVINHAQPAWLRRQHLDIYFPSRNVAVEYQGAQHQRPIEFFGGETAFKKQQERDARKRQLCKKHGCKLVYAYSRYNISNVEHQIRENSADKDATHVQRGDDDR